MALDQARTKFEARKRNFEEGCVEGTNELQKEEVNIRILRGVQTRIKRSYERLLSASDSLIDLLLKVNPPPVQEIDEAEREQSKMVQKADIILTEMEEEFDKAKHAAEDEVSISESKSDRHLHRLPKLELPKFGGEARDWLQFWSAFQSIHDDDSIAATMKFQYLSNCMTVGSVAQELVASYPVTAANYPQVISSMKERFGREDMLVEVYVRDLIAVILENRHNKSENFSSLFVRLSSQLRALGSLGVTTDKCAAILYPMVESALPEDVFVVWERYRHHTITTDKEKKTSEKHLETLMEFLKFEVEGSERIRLARQPFSYTVSNKQERSKNKPGIPTAASLVVTESKSNSACVFCDGKHSSEKCCKAVSINIEERRKLVKDKRRCFACLRSGHSVNKCREHIKCVSCGRKHFAILCPDIKPKSENNKQEDENKTKQESSSLNMCNQISSGVLLQTILVKVVGPHKSKVIRVMFDNGSQNSYILDRTASELGLQKIGQKEVIHVLFGNVLSKPQKHNCYHISVEDLQSKFRYTFNIQDSNRICGSIGNIPRGNWMVELKQNGITILDNCDSGSSEIEMLLGSDVYGKLLTGKKIELKSGPVALETKFGWTVSGTFKDEDNSDSTNAVLSYHVHDATIQDLWNLDVIGIHDSIKEKNKQELAAAAMDHFKQTVSRKEDGRYVVCLPWIENHPVIPDYRFIAEKKLASTSASLKKQGVLQAYHEVFTTWEAEGVIERVNSGKGHFLSNHGVLKPDSTTTPVRPVFNASFKTKGNFSLNDCLEIGPNMLEEIPTVVIRFRAKPVGVTSDIKKAFLQIEIAVKDRSFLRFLWYADGTFQQVQEFQHTRAVFGVNCSPFLLAAVLDHILANCEEKFQRTAEILRNSFYVDNSCVSLSSYEEALQFKEEATELLALSQMDLRCWEIGPSIEDKNVPVLGLSWNLKNDDLACDLRGTAKKIDEGPTTRRRILSVAHSLFDPIGMTSAYTIIPKMLLQTTYKLKAGWDTVLPEEVDKRFKLWCQQLEQVASLKIPRCLAKNQDMDTWTLHVFTDASSSAYAACVYLRSGNPGKIEVQLVMARSRVAPLKDNTIPRLELIGCVCGARIAKKVKEILAMPQIPVTYWTDSPTALAWIKQDNIWSMFVSNRVKEIQQLSSIEDWRHVPGKLNPADIPSRGASIKYLVESAWHEGPDWLKLEAEAWPRSSVSPNKEEIEQELKKTVISHVNAECNDVLIQLNKFSDFHKIIRIVVYIRRFLDWIVSKKTKSITTGLISYEEFKTAEERIMKLVQCVHFQGVDNKLKKLNVYEDKGGLIRLKTRLFPGEEKGYSCPLVLPAKEPLVQKLIWKEHHIASHAGVQLLQTKLREKYWILQSRRTIRGVLKLCVKCLRFRAQSVQVSEGHLPEDRVRVGPAFDVTGVDMAGPMMTKGNKKVWIAIFTCATYRAIHLELCSSLTTETFLAALRRFVARRGRPSIIYSDNGLNFVGCSNLLKKVNWKKIVDLANVESITWKFNPPTGAWWGGFWERMIGIVKQLLRSVLGSSRVTSEELQTLLCDVEAVVNNRPLTYVSEDADDLLPLTPNKMISNCGTSIVPDVDAAERDILVLRYRNMQSCRDEMRNRFRKEYLSMLVSAQKSKKNRQLNVGDVVLIGDDQKKRINWPMGVIEEVIPGRDGVVRVVKLKTANGSLMRPVQRLITLEINNNKD